jgi:alginate O-acetyltransferase complex protein AlgI
MDAVLFHTARFGFFLIAVLVVAGVLARHRRARQAFLLVASYVFYAAWNVRYLGLIVFSTLLDYVVGAAIHRSADTRVRKVLLGISLAGNLGVLAVFKYYGFFVDSLLDLLAVIGLYPSPPALHLLLPVGISFYTFQSMSYTIDIYRQELEPRRSLLEFSLFVTFFPQLVAGPIVRARQFLPQLDGPQGATEHQTGSGIYLILKGLLKKVVIADVLAVSLVDPVFSNPLRYGAGAILAAIYGFKFQIYNDFSGYSDIAIGAGRLLGYELPINFRSPFKAATIADYWRRWHISMSTWFRDYVFVPLGGSRSGLPRTWVNTLITMGLVGLWHGAAWTFVWWGLYHGVLLCLFTALVAVRSRPGLDRLLPRVPHLVGVLSIFHLTMLGAVLFRARDLATVRLLFSRTAALAAGAAVDPRLVALIGAAMLLHFTPEAWKEGLEERFAGLSPLLQGAAVAAVIALLVLVSGQAQPYYYFQF